MRLPVMIFTETMESGGTEQQMIELARRLDRRRFEIILACKHRRGQLLAEVERPGIPIVEVQLNSFLEMHALRQLKRLVELLRERDIQILHTTGNMGNTFVALAGLLARVPVVLTSRRDLGCFTPEKLRPIQKLLGKLGSGVMVNAEYIRQQLIDNESFAPHQIHKILNGINLRKFKVHARETAAIRREFQLDGVAPVITVIANLKPIKGHQYFLPAFQRICGRYPNARALIVGECIEQEWVKMLRYQSWALGLERNVIFTDFRQDVPGLLSASSLFVLPSLSEGFSNALMEAMASPLPIVATAVGGTQELLEHNHHGLLVPPGDIEQMARAMMHILNQPAFGEQLARAAATRIKSLSIDRMVTETELLYEKLYQRSSRSPALSQTVWQAE